MLRTSLLWLSSVLCVALFVAAGSGTADAQAPGPQGGAAHVALPKLPAPAKKDRSGLPPVPVFKDIAKEVGLTVPHVAAPEAHYVIDSTSGGAGLFDCDDDGRLDAVLIDVLRTPASRRAE